MQVKVHADFAALASQLREKEAEIAQLEQSRKVDHLFKINRVKLIENVTGHYMNSSSNYIILIDEFISTLLRHYYGSMSIHSVY